ncbi:GGDEF domain-containing protein [Castellaniella defragrans]|nr:GGDEF domain-containing protein [Castellaniella defragrans]
MRKNDHTFHVCVIGEADLSDCDGTAGSLHGTTMPAGAHARWWARAAAAISLALCLLGAARALAAVPEAACPALGLSFARADIPSLPRLCFLRDAAHALGPEDILGGRAPMERRDADQLVFRQNQSVYWVYAPLRNLEPAARTWFLQLDYPLLDEVDVWVYDLGTDPATDLAPDPAEDSAEDPAPGAAPRLLRTARMGDARPFDARPVRHRLFLMPLDFGPGQRLAVVLRVRSSGAINIPLSLHSGASAIGWAQDHGLSQGMFLGALAMLALFNAALYLRLRIRQSLYNTAYILCAGLFLTSMSGLSFQYLWPDWPWLANRSVPLTETLAILSLLWFTRHFLAIDAGRWPRQARLMRLLAWIGAGLLAASLLVPYSLIIKIDTVYALACMVAMFGLGLRHLRQGERAARWYVLSWLVFFAGYLAYGLAAFGYIPGFMAQERWMQVALGSQMFLLTYAEVMQLHDLMRRALEIEASARSSLQYEVQSRTADLRATMGALEQANRQLRELTLHDPLTGLLNRRGLDEALARFAANEGAAPRGTLVIFDLDHFKRVNDVHGHEAGDAALRWVAEVLLNLLRRRSDVLARFGGEEFVALLPATSLEDAIILAAGVLEHVRRNAVELDDGSTIALTLSAGAAHWREGETPQSLFRRADENLYRAKAAGRDRLVADGES